MSLSTKRPGVKANPATPPHVAVAWACGVLSAVVYGLTPTIAALSYGTGLTPTMLVALRSLFGAAAILLFAWATGRIRRTSWRSPSKLMLVCGPLFGFQLLCYFAAVQSTGVQVAVVVVHVYPVFVLLMVWLTYRQRHSPLVIGLCLFMIAGIGLVGWTGAADVKMAGIGLAVASALGYALYLVLGERWVQEVGAVVSGGLVTAGAGLTAGAVALVTTQSLSISSMGWVSVILQGAFMIPIGIGCAFYAVRRLGAVPLSLLGLLEPLVGVLAASLVLAESLMPGQWAGMAVILLACGLLPWATSTKRRVQTHSSANRSSSRPIR